MAALVAASGLIAFDTAPGRAADAVGMKAVIIVGPASSSTGEYLDRGEAFARRAEAQGMTVRRIFTPHATWARVREHIQGANLVVYLGHGNGWPSDHPPFQEDSKDGFGLNPCDGSCGTSGPTKYYGGDHIRDKVRLADNALVVLQGLCYASGNAESGQPPEFDRGPAVQRVDNFAAAFLNVGARAVFAFGWPQRIDVLTAFATTNRTVDEIFMTPGSPGDYNDGFNSWDDYYRQSDRTPWARIHLDPHRRHGHLRAVSGDLAMSMAEWRGGPRPPDTRPPVLQLEGAGGSGIAGAVDPLTFSPNGDGVDDRLLIDRRLSEPATIDIEIRNAGDEVVRTMRRSAAAGDGRITWDGVKDGGGIARDGRFEMRLTPRDRAGNVGETRSVQVRVLTALRILRASREAIHVSDGDALAATTRLTTQLRQDARVTFQIRKGDSIVRTRWSDELLAAGDLAWTWDGTADDGAQVPTGGYRAVISATTDEGTLRYTVPLWVGPFRWSVSDASPARGDRIRVALRSTERLEGAIRLRVEARGAAPFTVRMTRDDGRAVATFRVPRDARQGTLRLTVVATDARGGHEGGTTELRVH